MNTVEDKRKRIRRIVTETILEITVVVLAVSFRVAFINGYSMYPTYKDGEITIINTWDKKPEVGKIMVYKDASNRYIIHRVLRVHSNEIEFKGDNNQFIDPVVNIDRLVGTIVNQRDKVEDNNEYK